MKKYFIPLIIFLGFYGISSALNPVKVAIVNPGATNVQIDAEIIDLEGPTTIYVAADQGTYNADDNGLISFRVGVSDANWDGVGAAGIDGSWVLNIYTDGTLYAQYRLDKILFDQAGGLLSLDENGNLVPDDTTSQTLGTSERRWKEIYVSGSSLHIGENGNEAVIGFNTVNNEMLFTINSNDEVTISQLGTIFNSNVEASAGLDISAGTFELPLGGTVNEITSIIDGSSTNSQLPTAAAINSAIGGVNLQAAYEGGSTITSDLTNGDVVIAGTEEFDVQTPLINSSTNIVLIQDNFRVNGTSDLRGTISNNGGGTAVTVDDIDGFAVINGVISATAGLDVTGANLDVGGGSFTVTPTGIVSGASASYTGTVDAVTLTEGGNAVPNATESPNAAGNISGTFAVGLTIDAGAVGNTELADASVTTAKLADASVTTAKLADNSVTSAKITDGTIAAVDIGTGAVTSTEILDGTIATVDLADDAVTSVKILTDAVGLDALDQAANYNFSGTITIATADINGGNIDGTEIGATTQAAGSFTTLTATSTSDLQGTISNSSLNNSGAVHVGDEFSATNTTTSSTVTLNNSNGGANTHAIVVTNGHTQYSSDASTTVIATSGNITVGNNSVIRFNTNTAAASSITISTGTNTGQVIYITNEDIGDLTFDSASNVLKAYVIPAQEARPFVWNGGNWVMM